jgi:hypothetical protein
MNGRSARSRLLAMDPLDRIIVPVMLIVLLGLLLIPLTLTLLG